MIYNLEGQPARQRKDYAIEVYLGGGRWIEYDDPTGGFGYASPLSDEDAAELIAEWDEEENK